MKRIVIVGFLIAVVLAGSLWMFWPRRKAGLVLYSAVDYGQAVAEAFTKATGIRVTTIRLSTGALLARISAEAHRPAWTLAWFDGNQAAAALDQAGLLERQTTPDLPWTVEGRSLLPADHSYTPTGLTLAGAFTYRPAVLRKPPHTWSDLAQPALYGAVGMNNPAISGPMYPLLAGLLKEGGGWPQGRTFVTAIKNNGLHVYAKNDNTLQALRAGDIKVAVTQSSAAWYLAAKYPSLHVVVPKPAFALPSVLVVASGVPSRTLAAAKRFIRFAMKPDIQRMRMADGGADGYYWPVTADAPAPIHGLPSLKSLTVVALSPTRWGPREAPINQWFSKTIVGQ